MPIPWPFIRTLATDSTLAVSVSVKRTYNCIRNRNWNPNSRYQKPVVQTSIETHLRNFEERQYRLLEGAIRARVMVTVRG